jgi:acetate kinase
VLGGVDAILYSGGIGHNSAEVRARTAGQFGWCGVELDSEKNAAAGRGDRCISSPGSRVGVWVIPAEEELLIARAVLQCLHAGR